MTCIIIYVLKKILEDYMAMDLKEVKGAIVDIKQRASKIEVYL